MGKKHKIQSIIEEAMDIEQPNKSFIQVNMYVFPGAAYRAADIIPAFRIQPAKEGFYFYVMTNFRSEQLATLIKVLFISTSVMRIKLNQEMSDVY